MTTLELILIILLCVFTFAVIVFYFIKALKNEYLGKVYDAITKAMKEAEVKYTDGEMKKQYVLEKVKEVCKQSNIPYEFISTLISKSIEGIIKGYNSMTK